LLSAKHGFREPLFYVLLTAAVLARLLSTTLEQNLGLSASFLCGMLAIGFLDPASAFLIPFVAEGVGWLAERYRPQALIINWAGSATPTAFAALGFESLALDPQGAAFPIVLGLFGAAVLLVNFVTVAPLMAMLDDRPVLATLGVPSDFYPTLGINILMTAALAALYAQTSLATIAFVLAVILAFAYMMRLVGVARERTKEYANLSWGVLSSLIRTLDERDKRAARHCAAVANRSSRTPPGCCTTSGDSRCPIASWSARDGSARRTGRRSAATPPSAPTCSRTSASTGRWPRSCSATTSASTGADIRAASRATKSPRSPGSSLWRRSTTR
jgi:hypothetical protein